MNSQYQIERSTVDALKRFYIRNCHPAEGDKFYWQCRGMKALNFIEFKLKNALHSWGYDDDGLYYSWRNCWDMAELELISEAALH